VDRAFRSPARALRNVIEMQAEASAL